MHLYRRNAFIHLGAQLYGRMQHPVIILNEKICITLYRHNAFIPPQYIYTVTI